MYFTEADSGTDSLPGDVEQLGHGPPRVELVHAPWIQALQGLAPGSAHLAYVDPPFGTGLRFRHADHLALAFDDPSSLAAWEEEMRPLLQALVTSLDAEGSLFLHVDARRSPRAALLGDALFGEGARGPRRDAPGFRNEIVWLYGLGGSSARSYPRKHDTLLWYSRGSRWTFEPPRVPATSRRLAGQQKKAPDWWTLPTLNNMAAERTGYPTQKPLALLDRIVRAHTRLDDLVVDPLCGSGTTLVAAALAGRRAWGSDRSALAVATARARLLDARVPCTVRWGPAPPHPEVTVWRRDDGLELADGRGIHTWVAGRLAGGVFRGVTWEVAPRDGVVSGRLEGSFSDDTVVVVTGADGSRGWCRPRGADGR